MVWRISDLIMGQRCEALLLLIQWKAKEWAGGLAFHWQPTRHIEVLRTDDTGHINL